MAGGHSAAKPSNAVFYVLGILWLLAIVIVAYLYLSHRFTLYLDTHPATASTTPSVVRGFTIASPAFGQGGAIPTMYTCDAKQVSPPLTISGTPDAAHSLVLIMEDRDLAKSLKADGVFLHWTLFDIPPSTTEIGTGEVIGVSGASGNGVAGYIGPCPPRGYEPAVHRYHFDLFALDKTLDLPAGARVSDIRAAMEGHVISHTTLMGTYERIDRELQ